MHGVIFGMLLKDALPPRCIIVTMAKTARPHWPFALFACIMQHRHQGVPPMWYVVLKWAAFCIAVGVGGIILSGLINQLFGALIRTGQKLLHREPASHLPARHGQ